MPKGPKGQKRPADVVKNAVTVMRIATGEQEELISAAEIQNSAAAALGRRGGLARASNMSKARRVEIARRAASARHGKRKARNKT